MKQIKSNKEKIFKNIPKRDEIVDISFNHRC